MEAGKRVKEYLDKAPKWVIYELAAYGRLRTVKAAPWQQCGGTN